MKRRIQDISEEEKIKTLDVLYTAASSISGRSAVKLFLRDLLTASERVMLGRRILIARMLIRGNTHKHIEEKLGVGAATIYRVSKWLHDQFPGFENAIAEMEKEMKRRKKKIDYGAPFSYARLKKKYPLHFLLFPAPKSSTTKQVKS